MKVRIIQAIDIEDVPSRVHEFLESALQDINKLQGFMQSCLKVSGINSETVLKYSLLKESLEKLRSEVASIDQELSDIDSILEGYIGIIDEPATTPPPVPAPNPQVPTQPQPQPPAGKKDVNKG